MIDWETIIGVTMLPSNDSWDTREMQYKVIFFVEEDKTDIWVHYWVQEAMIGVCQIHWMAVGVSRDWHRHGAHCNNGVTRAECWVCRAGCGDDGVRISGDNIHRLSQPSDARLRNMRHCLMSDGNKVSFLSTDFYFGSPNTLYADLKLIHN